MEQLATPENLQQTQQYVDFIKTNLQPLADHLKVGIEWLWNILVNQVRVEAIVYLIVIVLLVIKSTTLLIIAYKSLKKATFYKYLSSSERTIYVHKKTGEVVDWDTWYEDKKSYNIKQRENTTNIYGYLTYWCGTGGVLLMIFTSILSATAIPKIVTGLVNPQYGALERIVQFSQGKIPNQENKQGN